MFRDYLKKLGSQIKLDKLEKSHAKYKQTEKYKKLTAQEKHEEDSAFYQVEYSPIWEELEVLETKELLNKASGLTVPFPRHWEDKEEKYWEEGAYGNHYLKVEGKHELLKSIREEQKARRDSRTWWLPLITAFTGLLGVLLAIITTSWQMKVMQMQLTPKLEIESVSAIYFHEKLVFNYNLFNSGNSDIFNIERCHALFLVDKSSHNELSMKSPVCISNQYDRSLFKGRSSLIHQDDIGNYHLVENDLNSKYFRIDITVRFKSEEFIGKACEVSRSFELFASDVDKFIIRPSSYWGFSCK